MKAISKLILLNGADSRLVQVHTEIFHPLVIANAVISFSRYFPTRLWGFSGHIQTIIQGLISRLHCPLVDGRRQSFKTPDGATVTYDVYQPIESHPAGGKKLFFLFIKFSLSCAPGPLGHVLFRLIMNQNPRLRPSLSLLIFF